MKKTIKVRTHRKLPLMLVIPVALLVVGGVAFGLYNHHTRKTNDATVAQAAKPRDVNSVDYSPSTAADNSSNETRKDNPSSAASTLDNGATTTPTSSTATVTVTHVGQYGSNIQVGASVDGATSGTCTLSISQSGQQTITQTSQVSLQNNSYDCGVFSVPLSQFAKRDGWTVSVALSGSATAKGTWAVNPTSIPN